MSEATFDSSEHAARINRSLAEMENLNAETRKYVAEHDKLFAEQRKLLAEERKLDRDRRLAPLVLAVALTAGLASLLGQSLSNLLFHTH